MNKEEFCARNFTSRTDNNLFSYKSKRQNLKKKKKSRETNKMFDKIIKSILKLLTTNPHILKTTMIVPSFEK